MNGFDYSVRYLRKNPSLLAIGALSLGLGLGLTTTMFAVLDAVMHPQTPYKDPDRLYRVMQRGDGSSRRMTAWDRYAALKNGWQSFEGMAAAALGNPTIQVGSREQGGTVTFVTPNFFALLGARPLLGRGLSVVDSIGTDEAVVSLALWKRAYAGRHLRDGPSITVGNRSYTVIGVMPEGLTFPWETSAWLHLSPSALPPSRDASPYWVAPIVRLKPDVSAEAARAELSVTAARLTAEYGNERSSFSFELVPLRRNHLRIREFHLAMMGAAIAVLLIACANLSNLLLAHGIGRRREFALRMALGATRTAISVQVLTECLLVAISGGAIGLLSSLWAVDILRSQILIDVGWLGMMKPELSWRVFSFAGLAVSASTLVFGLLPAQRASSHDLSEPLKLEAGTIVAPTRGRYSYLVIAEIALCMTLLMAAGLLVKAARRVSEFDFGYDARRLWSVYTAVPQGGATSRDQLQKRIAHAREALTASLRVLPGVQDAATLSAGATDGGVVAAGGEGLSYRLLNTVSFSVVSPSFLRTLGIRVLEGRDFLEGDAQGSGVVIVDRRVATQLWGSESPIGRLLKLGAPNSGGAWLPVVGVAADAVLSFEDDPTMPPARGIYVVRGNESSPFLQVVLRASGDDARWPVRVSRAVEASLPGRTPMVVPWLASFRDVVAAHRVMAGLFSAIGVLALGLAVIGLYGVLAYSVKRRTREFGVRLALGAQRSTVLRLVLRQGLVMALAGTAAGTIVSLWAGSLLRFWLYTVSPTDVVSLAIAGATVLVASVGSCVVPAVAATRADPLEILRAI